MPDPLPTYQEGIRVRRKSDGKDYFILKASFQERIGMWLYWIAPKYRNFLHAIGSECVWEDELEAVEPATPRGSEQSI